MKLAEAHNLRRIPTEFKTFNHIDPNETQNNIELIKLSSSSLEQQVLDELANSSVDMSLPQNKRKDKGYALEFIYTPSAGWSGNYLSLYQDCCHWQTERYPSCPLVHAIIHLDEGQPHLHTVMVPIVGSRLLGSDIRGFKTEHNRRNRDLFAKVASRYGFNGSEYLKGDLKKRAAEKVLKICESLDEEHFKTTIWRPFKQSVHSRPENYMDELGITIDDILKNGYLIRA